MHPFMRDINGNPLPDTPMGRIAGRWPGNETDKEIEQSLSNTSERKSIEPPDCIRRLTSAGWKIYYDPATRYIGADHPLGGRQSIAQIARAGRNDFDMDAIGQSIADWLQSTKETQ